MVSSAKSTSKNASENLSKDIRYLSDSLGEVIRELSGEDVFEVEEEVRQLSKNLRAGDKDSIKKIQVVMSSLSLEKSYDLAMAFTTYFELNNIAEENERLRILQKRRSSKNFEKETYWRALKEMSTSLAEKDISDILNSMCIELVFTAHPTEAKRKIILDKLNRISNALAAGRNAEVKAQIASLWLTARSRHDKPSVIDEVARGLWYFENVLFPLTTKLQEDFSEQLADVWPNLKPSESWIAFSSWVGGDRDGHPDVTAEVSRKTFMLHREVSQRLFEKAFCEVGDYLSVSKDRLFIRTSIEALLNELNKSELNRSILEQFEFEPIRGILYCVGKNFCSFKKEHLFSILTKLEEYFVDFPEGRRRLGKLRTLISVFGTHLASLDIRQHSENHEEVVGELLNLHRACLNYKGLSEKEKCSALEKIIHSDSLPIEQYESNWSELARSVIEPLQVYREEVKAHGREAIGHYIISMASDCSDYLEAMFLLKAVNLKMPVAPLFETRADLQNAPNVLKEMFSTKTWKAEAQSDQLVMLGYSDSNKDAGYYSANWELFRSQDEIDKQAQADGVNVTFFHGRGGTIARGGGPAARAILSQPVGLHHGRVRITEQGEVLSSRYHRQGIARRMFEQMAYGVLLGSARARKLQDVSKNWRKISEQISSSSCDKYQSLVRNEPELIGLWKEVTPIEFIKDLNIGSRPASRKALDSVEDLRAIPWVFSWLQTRFVLPGWYGLGTGLKSCSKEIKDLQSMYKEWAYFKGVIDNAQLSLSKADLPISKLYLELSNQTRLAKTIFSNIEAEYALTRESILELTQQKELLENEPVLKNSIERRNPYVDPLNYIQIEMIKRYRKAEPGADQMLLKRIIELTISGVSEGLRNTG